MNKDSKKVQCSSEARGVCVCVCVCVCGTRACTHSYCTACIPAPEGTAAAVRLYFLSTSFFFSEGFPYPLSPQTPPPLPSLLICQPPTSLALFLSASTFWSLYESAIATVLLCNKLPPNSVTYDRHIFLSLVSLEVS